MDPSSADTVHATRARGPGSPPGLAAQVRSPSPQPGSRPEFAARVRGRARGRLIGRGARATYTEARLCRRGLDDPNGKPEIVELLQRELICDAWMNAGGVAEARERLRRAQRSGRRSTPGGWRTTPDNTRTTPDGTRTTPDGTQTTPDNTQTTPDGTRTTPDNTRTTPDNTHTTPDGWGTLVAWEAVCDGRSVGPDMFDGDDASLAGTYDKFMMIACGHLDAARDRCTALIEVARPRGWLIALAHGCFIRSIALVLAGRMRDAAADARLAFDFKLGNSPSAAVMWSAFPLVAALTELDEPEAAEAVLTAAPHPEPGALSLPLFLQARAGLRLTQHRPAEAYRDLIDAASTWQRLEVRHPGLNTWRVDACHALIALGEPLRGRALAEEHLALAKRAGSARAHGSALRALAATADPNEAPALLRQAIGILADSPERLEHVRALADLGAALRRANHRAAAREPLAEALDLADRDGMLRLARRARHELQAAGARPRRSAAWGAGSLTAAEHRVAELAVRGLSNPEIAQQLYVTRRTVETHLTHVFQKLGVAGRAGLDVASLTTTGD
jgi:DNA-binding NarL/FixJ family response regulator